MPEESDSVKTSVEKRISDASPNLSVNEKAMLAIIVSNWGEGMRISQREIADNEGWLALHSDYRGDLENKYYETATRVVREEIRSLRVKHKIPVLSDGDGYFMPLNGAEVTTYLKRMESEAKARAAASLATYHAMQDALGVKSEFFDSLESNPAADDESEDEVEPEAKPEEKPKAEMRKVKADEYIWEVVEDYFKSHYAGLADFIRWEKGPNSVVKWRVVFTPGHAPDKTQRNDIRSTFYSAGFGYPEFTQVTGGDWVMSMLCTEHAAKSAFRWRKRMTKFDQDQKLVWSKVQVIAAKESVSLAEAEWRLSLTKPETHCVLVFPKGTTGVVQKLKDALLDSRMAVLVEAGSPNKLIFKIADNSK